MDIERRYVGLIRSIEVHDLKNIKFIGRLAQWSHKIHMQDVVLKSKTIKEWEVVE